MPYGMYGNSGKTPRHQKRLTVAEARETSINNGAGRCRDILPIQLQSYSPTTNNQSIPHLLFLRSPPQATIALVEAITIIMYSL